MSKVKFKPESEPVDKYKSAIWTFLLEIKDPQNMPMIAASLLLGPTSVQNALTLLLTDGLIKIVREDKKDAEGAKRYYFQPSEYVMSEEARLALEYIRKAKRPVDAQDIVYGVKEFWSPWQVRDVMQELANVQLIEIVEPADVIMKFSAKAIPPKDRKTINYMKKTPGIQRMLTSALEKEFKDEKPKPWYKRFA
jgi:predicted transcriptional regulator